MTHNEYLIELDACEPAQTYAATHPTLKSAWDACTIPDWLVWLVINDAWYKRENGDTDIDPWEIRVTCRYILHLSCDQIRAALSCPEVPDHE